MAPAFVLSNLTVPIILSFAVSFNLSFYNMKARLMVQGATAYADYDLNAYHLLESQCALEEQATTEERTYEGSEYEYAWKYVPGEITAEVTAGQTIVYNGCPQKAQLTVKYGDDVLVENKDFTAKYENNVNAGTAAVTVNGIGSYTGTVELTYTIEPKSILKANLPASLDDQAYTGAAVVPAVKIYDGKNLLEEGKDYQVTALSNTAPGIAIAAVQGIGNYSEVKEFSFKITTGDVIIDEIIAAIDGLGTVTLESGTAITTIRDLYNKLNASQKALINNYEILVAAEKEYRILSTEADKIKGLKLKAKKNGSIAMSWNKASARVTGYEIFRSKSKNSEFRKIWTIGKNSPEHVNIHMLKKDRRYYYKVRGYSIVDGERYYTQFSKIKSARCKASRK